MENIELFTPLICSVSTVLLLIFRRKRYNISLSATVFVLIFVGFFGYLGSSLASYVSYGEWSGFRFYGKVVFATLTLVVLSHVLKIDTSKILDFYSPADILALAIMKVGCVETGCCSGIELYLNQSGHSVYFPSQIVELFVALMLFMTIIFLEKLSICEGYRYDFYLISYGITRLILNYFRKNPGESLYLSQYKINTVTIFCIIIICFGVLGIYSRKHDDSFVFYHNEYENGKNISKN